MPTPANQPTPLSDAERQAADALLARAACSHTDRVEITTMEDLSAHREKWLCTFCGDRWHTPRTGR